MKDIKIPTNESVELAQNKVKINMNAVVKIKKNTRNLMVIKKATFFIIKVTKDCAKCLIMEANMPHEACIALKERFSVSKASQYFTNLDK